MQNFRTNIYTQKNGMTSKVFLIIPKKKKKNKQTNKTEVLRGNKKNINSRRKQKNTKIN